MDSDSLLQYELKQYKNEIKSKLPFSNCVTKKLLNDLENGINDYISSNGTTAFDEITEEFGTPSDVAEELKNSTDVQVIKRKVNIKKALVAFVTVSVLLVGIGIVKITADAKIANAIYFNDCIEAVSYDNLNV